MSGPVVARPTGTGPAHREVSALSYVLRYGTMPAAAPTYLVPSLIRRGLLHQRTRQGHQTHQVSRTGLAWLRYLVPDITARTLVLVAEQARIANGDRKSA